MMKRKNKLVIETNEISKEAKISMRTRTITAIVLAAIVVPCFILGGWFFFALSILVTVFSAYELVKILNLKGKIKYFVYIASILISFSFVYWIFIKNNISAYLNNNEFSADVFLTNGFNKITSSIILILVTAGIFFSFCFISEEMDVGKTCYLIAMIIITSLCIQSFLYLRFSPNDLFKQAGVDVGTSLLLSAVMPIIANLGDFTFSAIKRNYNVKDFSNLLPGHGGLLDRIDSLLFTSGFISVMLIFINNGWNFFK